MAPCARYVGRRPGDAANSFSTDNYTVADAFAAYTMPINGYRVKWQLNVKNLFDKTYYPSSGGNLRVAVGNRVRWCCAAVSISKPRAVKFA